MKLDSCGNSGTIHGVLSTGKITEGESWKRVFIKSKGVQQGNIHEPAALFFTVFIKDSRLPERTENACKIFTN